MSEDHKKQLEQQLWNIANTLRGKMNADEFRDYILGFIFYKYLAEKILKEGGDTFPFPEISQKQKEQINLHVFEVLEEREKHSGKTLAQLYDPNKIPIGLKEAHHQLDLAIKRCYRLKPFESDAERLEYLFKEYEKMINKKTLLEKPKRTRKTKNS